MSRGQISGNNMTSFSSLLAPTTPIKPLLLSIIIYSLSSVALSLFIKYQVSYSSFNFPLASLATQFALNFLAQGLFLKFWRGSLEWDWHVAKHYLIIGALLGADYGLSNCSLRFNTILFYNMVKSTGPVFTLVAGWIFRVESFHWMLFLAVMMMSLGLMIASFYTSFHFIGLVLLLVANVVMALRMIYAQIMLQGRKVTQPRDVSRDINMKNYALDSSEEEEGEELSDTEAQTNMTHSSQSIDNQKAAHQDEAVEEAGIELYGGDLEEDRRELQRHREAAHGNKHTTHQDEENPESDEEEASDSARLLPESPSARRRFSSASRASSSSPSINRARVTASPTTNQEESTSKPHRVSTLQAFLYVAPGTSLFVFPFALILESRQAIEDVNHFDNPLSLTAWILLLILSLIVISFLGFTLNVSEFLVIQYTSSLTLVVIGIAKQITTILFAWIIFGDDLNAQNLMGYSITISGVALYQFYRFREQLQKNEENLEAGYANVDGTAEDDEDDIMESMMEAHNEPIKVK